MTKPNCFQAVRVQRFLFWVIFCRLYWTYLPGHLQGMIVALLKELYTPLMQGEEINDENQVNDLPRSCFHHNYLWLGLGRLQTETTIFEDAFPDVTERLKIFLPMVDTGSLDRNDQVFKHVSFENTTRSRCQESSLSWIALRHVYKLDFFFTTM